MILRVWATILSRSSFGRGLLPRSLMSSINFFSAFSRFARSSSARWIASRFETVAFDADPDAYPEVLTFAMLPSVLIIWTEFDAVEADFARIWAARPGEYFSITSTD